MRKPSPFFSWSWTVGLLVILLSMSLSACDNPLFGSSCSGINVVCSNGTVVAVVPDATAQAQAMATATAITKHKPLVSDPLSRQDSNEWGDDNICSFHDGAYFVTYNSSSSSTYTCGSSKLHYADIAIQVDVTLISGDDAGIFFRSDPSESEFYNFIVKNGQFALAIWSKSDTLNTLIPFTPNDAIHGMGQKNTLLAITKGDDFQFFVNGVFVVEIHDSTLTTGNLGFSVATDGSSNAQASFANLVVYSA